MISIVSHTNKDIAQPGGLGGASNCFSVQTLTGLTLRMFVRRSGMHNLSISNEHNESYLSDLDMT